MAWRTGFGCVGALVVASAGCSSSSAVRSTEVATGPTTLYASAVFQLSGDLSQKSVEICGARAVAVTGANCASVLGSPAPAPCPCYNFTAKGDLVDPTTGDPVVVTGLCPSTQAPTGDWTFSYTIYSEQACAGDVINGSGDDLVCYDSEDLASKANPNQSVEPLATGPNANHIVCLSKTASKEWSFLDCSDVTTDDDEAIMRSRYACGCTRQGAVCSCPSGLDETKLEEGCHLDLSCEILCGPTTRGCSDGCDDGNECTADGCSLLGACTHDVRTAGELCTGGRCDGNGVCVPTCPDHCADPRECWVAGCVANDCISTPRAQGEACSSGVCDGAGTCVTTCAGGCDDGNDCTLDACTGGTCTHTPVTEGSLCSGGSCDDEGICIIPFECDNTKYILTGNPSRLNILSSAGTLLEIGRYTERLNALGENPNDGLIYALTQQTANPQHLVSVNANGTFRDLGPIAGLNGSYPAGAFLQDGTFFVFNEGTSAFALIDVRTRTVVRHITPPGSPQYRDFAVNPLDGKLWGYNQAADALGTIDTTTGAFSAVFGPVYPPGNRNFIAGSAFFDLSGTMYLYSTPPGNPSNEVQNRLLSIDVHTGVITPVSTGPAVTDSDGASCSVQSL